MLIHRDAFVVHEVTTDEQTRYFLNGALVDKQGRTVATDGHVLARFTGAQMAPADFPKIDGVKNVALAENVIVTREDIRVALATIKKGGNASLDPQHVAIVPDGEKLTIATATHNRSVQITSRKVEGEFPAYEKVMKTDKPVRATVILQAAYLETLGRMAKQVGAKAITFTLHGEDETVLTQVFYTAKGENGVLDGAIMPMRA